MNKTETSCNNTSCTSMTETVPVNVDDDSRTEGIRHIDENWKKVKYMCCFTAENKSKELRLCFMVFDGL